MFTVLVIFSTPAIVSYSVEHFATLQEAQAYQPIGVNCTVKCIVLPGNLSEDQAIAEYLD